METAKLPGSRYFTVKSSIYVKQLLGIWLTKYWWIIILPLAGVALAGIWDARWLIVALMMLMILMPAVMAIVFFNFALSPEVAKRTLPQFLNTNAESFTISYAPHPESSFSPSSEQFTIRDIRTIEDNGKYLIIHMQSSQYSIIIIPASEPEGKRLYQSWHNFC